MPPKNNTQCTCNDCSKIIKENSNSIQCAKCGHWYHSKCTGLSVEEFKTTANKVKKNIMIWKCTPCLSEVSVRLTDSFSDTESEDGDVNISKCEKILEKLLLKHFHSLSRELETKFENFKGYIEDKLSEIRNEVDKVSKQCTDLGKKNSRLNDRITKFEDKIKSFTPQSTEDTIIELNERKRREVNVVAFNITESKKVDGRDRLEEDRTQFASIIPPGMSIDVNSLKLRRIGRQIPGKTRPLLIETKSVSEAREIMRSKPNPSSRVVFKPDMTRAQQAYLKSLRTELDSLSLNGECNKTIKYVNGTPRIVNKNFRQINGEKKTKPVSGILPEHKRAQN